MGKKVTYTTGEIIDLKASDGVNLDVGSLGLDFCDATKTAVADDEEEGWWSGGIVSNEVDLKPALEAFEAMANGKMMDKSQLGKKLEFDITLIAPKDLFRAIYNGNKNVTYVEPTAPISTTVDLTTIPTFDPDQLSIRVASSTGIIAGSEVIMETGSTATGKLFERLTVGSVDSTDHIIYFVDGYENLPEHGAVLKVIKRVEFTNEGVTIPSLKIRLRKKDHGKKAVTLFNFKTVKIEPTGRKLGVKSPSELTFKFSVIPEAKTVMSSTSTTEVTYNWGKEQTIFS